MTKEPPTACWVRRLDTTDPTAFRASRPPLLECLALLPVAYRVGQYIGAERSQGKEPIFDLSGPFLEPPNPGPGAGVPLGGLGGGAIGRGWRGDFNRWSLHPGRYVHKTVRANQFYLRVVTGTGEVHTQVLSVKPPCSSLAPLDPASVTYHALHPRSWTVYESPVPGVRVVLRQISPFLPQSYSEASLPCGVFRLEVHNLTAAAIQASVMFCCQNGLEGKGSRGQEFEVGGAGEAGPTVRGVNMACGGGGSPGEDDPSRQHPHCRGSFAIAAELAGKEGSVTCMDSFAIEIEGEGLAAGRSEQCSDWCRDWCMGGRQHKAGPKKEATMQDCLSLFEKDGKLHSLLPPLPPSSSSPLGAAVCVCQPVSAAGSSTFSFSLAWDNPWAAFGPHRAPNVTAAAAADSALGSREGASVPRYYSRFLGRSGTAAGTLAAYALAQASDWEARIETWQATVGNSAAEGESQGAEGPGAMEDKPPPYYKRQLCNELYYLVDGGTVWADTTDGRANPLCVDAEMGIGPEGHRCEGAGAGSGRGVNGPDVFRMRRGAEEEEEEEKEEEGKGVDCGDDPRAALIVVTDDGDGVPARASSSSSSSTSRITGSSRSSGSAGCESTTSAPAAALISRSSLASLRLRMLAHDRAVQASTDLGLSSLVGQFLYLEGHEYLMYNTVDVHFTASFALLQLWPHLQYSLQRDVGGGIGQSDGQVRTMLGTGEARVRKVAGCVPHDLGSPTEQPWRRLNAYNFQDVGAWRDLGPKFVLNAYRDYRFACRDGRSSRSSVESSTTTSSSPALRALLLLRDLYPACRRCMARCDAFDSDDDGMIENSSYPDQTYDIWTCAGVSAYCGGLYIAACRALSAMSVLVGDEEGSCTYALKASRGQRAYLSALWTGSYLKYDSSGGAHSDSIMADMLCGQWWTRVCGLDPVLPAALALSCCRTIFRLNVVGFAALRQQATASVRPDATLGLSSSSSAAYSKLGRDAAETPGLCGAVNGMRPDGRIDDSCLQSREVWTGTTYALASAMLSEARAAAGAPSPSCYSTPADDPLPDSAAAQDSDAHQATRAITGAERRELRDMAHRTAQGIHDAGWGELGYWFATPEAWDVRGNYRSLGYMRPLCIWAMEYAETQEEQ